MQPESHYCGRPFWLAGHVFAITLLCLMLPGAAFGQESATAHENPLEAGRQAYQAGELKDAYKLLKAAQAKAKSDDELSTVLLYQSMLYFAWEQDELAGESISQAANLDPARKLDTTEFPPSVISLFEKSRPTGHGSLKVETIPPGADIAIDGAPAGTSPVFMGKVPAGIRLLSISKHGFRSEARKITSIEFGRTEIVIELAPGDLKPPVISHDPVTELQEERPLAVRVEVEDNEEVAGVDLFLSQDVEPDFSKWLMETGGGKTFFGAANVQVKPGERIRYYIQARDAANNTANAGSPEEPFIVLVTPKDTEPPEVIHTPPQAVSDQESMVITARIRDNKALASVKLFYKRGDEEVYKEQNLFPLDEEGAHEFTIPGHLLQAEEIDYYFLATDRAGNFFSKGNEEAPFKARPLHIMPRSEAVILERPFKGGRPGKEVTISGGSLKGYSQGQTLYAINIERKIVDPATKALLRVDQQLAGEIHLTYVDRATAKGRVVNELFLGAIKKETIVRFRPSPPREVEALSREYETITVSWNKSPDPEVKGYLVYRATKIGGPYAVFAKIERRDNISAKDFGSSSFRLEGGRLYYYRVRAFNASGSLSDFSVTVGAKVKTGPAPPHNLKAVSGEVRQVRLSWDPSPDPAVAGYRVYRAGSEKGEYEIVDEFPDPKTGEFIDMPRPEDHHAFEEGVEYWYAVLAYDSKGRKGELTKAVKAMSMEKPPAPANLRIDAMNEGSVSLGWDMAVGDEISGYRLYRSASEDGLFELIANIDERASTHYVDKSSSANRLRTDIIYYYKLTQVNQAGAESDFSSAVYAASLKPPETPSYLQATSNLSGVIILSWSAPNDNSVAGYIVYRGETPETAYTLATVAGGRTESFEDTGSERGLEAGASYYYSLKSVTASGVEGEPTGWARGSTKQPVTAPMSVTASVDRRGVVLIEWQKPEAGQVAGYRVMKSKDGVEYDELDRVVDNFYLDNLDQGLPDQKLSYLVQAIDLDGEPGPMSAPAQLMKKPPPSAPKGLLASSGASSVVLQWTPNLERDVTGYEVYVIEEGFKLKVGYTETYSWLVEHIAPGAEYKFAVAAKDASGQVSELSEIVTVTARR